MKKYFILILFIIANINIHAENDLEESDWESYSFISGKQLHQKTDEEKLLQRVILHEIEPAKSLVDKGVRLSKKIIKEYIKEDLDYYELIYQLVLHYHYAEKEFFELQKSNKKIPEYDSRRFSFFYYAAISGNNKLIDECIENGYDINKELILEDFEYIPLKASQLTILNKRDNTLKHLIKNGIEIDCEIIPWSLENLSNNEIKEFILEKAEKSPYGLIIKKHLGIDVQNFRKEENKTYIGISTTTKYIYLENIMPEIASYIMEKNDDVIIKLITHDMLNDSFIQKFDGLINPGASDTFPEDREFSINDLNRDEMLDIEIIYQDVTALADKHQIPLLGICSGHQHMSLFKNGTLKKIPHYWGNKIEHQAYFISGTLPYFMVLTPNEQMGIITSCQMPEIIIDDIETWHNFAIVPGKLGDTFKLGATSEEGVIQAIYNDAPFIGFQFHFESNYFYQYENKPNRHKLILDNFVNLCKMPTKKEVRKILNLMQNCIEKTKVKNYTCAQQNP